MKTEVIMSGHQDKSLISEAEIYSNSGSQQSLSLFWPRMLSISSYDDTDRLRHSLVVLQPPMFKREMIIPLEVHYNPGGTTECFVLLH